MKTPHPHKDLICQWAEDTSLTFQRFEVETNKWKDTSHPHFFPECEYRIKPKMISLNGFEYPEPLKEEPLWGTQVFHFAEHAVRDCGWAAMDWQLELLKQRRLHLTREAAQQHFEATIKAGGGEV